MPAMAMNKRLQRLRKAHGQVAELNAKRDELHLGGWDGSVGLTYARFSADNQNCPGD